MINVKTNKVKFPTSSLIEAVKKNNIVQITAILKNNPNKVNQTNDQGQPVLLIAAEKGYEQAVTLLFQYGAKIETEKLIKPLPHPKIQSLKKEHFSFKKCQKELESLSNNPQSILNLAKKFVKRVGYSINRTDPTNCRRTAEAILQLYSKNKTVYFLSSISSLFAMSSLKALLQNNKKQAVFALGLLGTAPLMGNWRSICHFIVILKYINNKKKTYQVVMSFEKTLSLKDFLNKHREKYTFNSYSDFYKNFLQSVEKILKSKTWSGKHFKKFSTLNLNYTITNNQFDVFYTETK